MSRLKVLIPVDHAVGISGPHRNVVGSLNALGAREDVDVVLLTSKIDANEPYASAPNIDIRLGYQPSNLGRLLANLWSVNSAAKGCDVVYVPSGLKSLLYAQAAHVGRRLVAGPNVTPLPISKRHDSPGPIELRVLSDAWFEASKARRDHVRRVSGIQSVGVIYHAIDTRKFSPDHRDPHLWRELGVPDDAIKMVFVGRDNEPRKGVTLLFEAMEILNRHRPSMVPDVHLIIVGRMTDATKARAAALPNVSLLGFMQGNELPAIYASADMSIVPSIWENFPFTVMEALASGIPVIGANAGGIPEMIVDGRSGVLVDISDGRTHFSEAGELLAMAIGRLAGDAAERETLGANARRRVLEHFSESRLGDDLMAIFRGDSPVSQVASRGGA